MDSELPDSNITHANITGKVPTTSRRMRRRGGKAKRVKLSADQKSHVKSLERRGQISPRAAASHGLQGGK